MLDDRQKTIDERLEAKGVRLETRGERVCVIASPVRAWQSLTRILSSWRRVFNVLSSWRSVATIGSIAFLLTACTDYYQQFEDEYAFGKTSGRFVFDGQTLTDQRNDQTYEVVKVGNLYWMNRNLGFEFYHSHDNATNVHCPKSSIETCEKTGFLYPGTRLDNLCIDGWRLPSTEEWKEYYNSSAYQSSTYGKDTYSGYLGGDESLNEYGKAAYFWTNAETDGKGYRKCVSVTSESNSFRQAGPCHEQWKLAVRCVKEVDGESGSQSTAKSSAQTTKKSSSSAKSSTAKSSSSMKQGELVNADPLKDSRDSQTYSTVAIGKQTWMAQNLNFEMGGSFCFDNLDGNCSEYGRLYTWDDAKIVCPSGWHLPSVEEWEKFFSTDIGKEMAVDMLGASCQLKNVYAPKAKIEVSVKPSAYQDETRCKSSSNYKECGEFFIKVVNNDDVDYTDLELRLYIGSRGSRFSELPDCDIKSAFNSSGQSISAPQIAMVQYLEDDYTGQTYLPIFINGNIPASGGTFFFQVKWPTLTFHDIQGGWSLVGHEGYGYYADFDGIDLTQAPNNRRNEMALESYTVDEYIPVYKMGELVAGITPDGSTEKELVKYQCAEFDNESATYWTSDGDEYVAHFVVWANNKSNEDYYYDSKTSFAKTVRCVKD